jgi:hypothetical protein
MTNGFNAQTATTSIGAQLSQLPSTNPLTGYVPVVVAFGVPTTNSQNGVVLSILVDLVGPSAPSQGVLNTLCPILKVSLAAAAGITDSTTLQGCNIATITGTSGKRSIMQSSNSTQIQMSSTLSTSSSQSGSSFVFLSVIALFVALFCLFL